MDYNDQYTNTMPFAQQHAPPSQNGHHAEEEQAVLAETQEIPVNNLPSGEQSSSRGLKLSGFTMVLMAVLIIGSAALLVLALVVAVGIGKTADNGENKSEASSSSTSDSSSESSPSTPTPAPVSSSQTDSTEAAPTSTD